MNTKGNDYKYNMYIRKLQKLAKFDNGIDVEFYRDFMDNVKEFQGLKHEGGKF